MKKIFHTFDLFVYVCSSYTKVRLLLEVSWWVDPVDRGEWGDFIQRSLVMFRPLFQSLGQELLIRVIDPWATLLPLTPRKGQSKDIIIERKI
jgi:hypothetical protein